MAYLENSTPVEWKVSLRKHRSTWYYFTTNPQGGGFGSNHCGSKRVALNNAMRGIPAGAAVEIVTENEGREVSRVIQTMEVK